MLELKPPPPIRPAANPVQRLAAPPVFRPAANPVQQFPILPKNGFRDSRQPTAIVVQAKRVFGVERTPTFNLLNDFAHEYFETATYRKKGWKSAKTGDDLTQICWAKAYLDYETSDGVWTSRETSLHHSGMLIGPSKEKSKGLRQIDGEEHGYTRRGKKTDHNAFCAETQVLTELRRMIKGLPPERKKLVRFFTNYTACACCEHDLTSFHKEFKNLEVVIRSLEKYRASKPVRQSTWNSVEKEKEGLVYVQLPRLQPGV